MCAGATMFSALYNNAVPGDDVAIMGIGGLGHLGVSLANHMCMNVTAFSGSKDVEAIKALGANNVVNSRDLSNLKKYY